MKNKEESEIDFQKTITPEQISGLTEISAAAKAGRQLRKIFYIVSLAGIGISFNACMSTGYVETEPTYLEYNRPPQPSGTHIWINGNWQYNQQKHIYVQKNGYWAKPSRHRTYVPGYWQSSSQGKYWVSGHYERTRR